MTTSPEISVIIPVYNAAQFIDRTLRNVVCEQFDSIAEKIWEIIIIDDCSSDNSAAIIKKWSDRYPENIKYICLKERSGVSNARNIALQNATGKYTYMMDADDLLLAGTLKLLVNTANANKSDIVRFTYKQTSLEEYFAYNNSVPKINEDIEFTTYTAYEFLDNTYGLVNYPGLWSVWSSLFRSDFLKNNNLGFIPGLNIGEDCLFQWSAMLRSPIVTATNSELYLYTINPTGCINGASQIHIANRADGLTKLANLEENFIRDNQQIVSTNTLQGWSEALTYVLRDRIACLIALNSPISSIFSSLKKFLHFHGVISPRLHPFHIANVKLSARASVMAWVVTRICSIAKKIYKFK